MQGGLRVPHVVVDHEQIAARPETVAEQHIASDHVPLAVPLKKSSHVELWRQRPQHALAHPLGDEVAGGQLYLIDLVLRLQAEAVAGLPRGSRVDTPPTAVEEVPCLQRQSTPEAAAAAEEQSQGDD